MEISSIIFAYSREIHFSGSVLSFCFGIDRIQRCKRSISFRAIKKSLLRQTATTLIGSCYLEIILMRRSAKLNRLGHDDVGSSYLAFNWKGHSVGVFLNVRACDSCGKVDGQHLEEK